MGDTSSMEVAEYREVLVRKRDEIRELHGVRPLSASMDTNTRQGDVADRATGTNEVHVQLRLRQTDAKILQAIEALTRIDWHLRPVPRCGEPIRSRGCWPFPDAGHPLQGKQRS
jgi:RNA polymerase-binding transcription factor DksA